MSDLYLGIIRPTIMERLWRYSELRPNGCRIWTGALDRGGYGAINVGGAKHKAHRLAYELLVGPIPDGLVIDHVCRNRDCINPAHLEPVTHEENKRRGARGGDWPYCRKGHPYDDDNTRITTTGVRICRACHRDNEKKRRDAARKAAA